MQQLPMQSLHLRPATRDEGEPALTARLLADAGALREELREGQFDHALQGAYGRELHLKMAESGLYDVLRPRCYGGLLLGLETFFRVGIKISRGDPGVGWSYLLGAGNVYQAASHFGRAAQDELFAVAPVVIASRAVPQGEARRVEGGYRVSGVWSYNSGVAWSTHAMPVAPVTDTDGSRDGVYMFIVPRAEYDVLGDWGGTMSIGLQASSSNSIRLDDVFVPEHRAERFDFKARPWGATGSKGFQIHRDSLYLGRGLFFFYGSLLTSQIGAAWAAFDEFSSLMSKDTPYPPRQPRRESMDFVRIYGELLAKIDAAEALLLGLARRFDELNESWTLGGQEFTAQEDARMRGAVLESARMATEVIELAFARSGSSSTRPGAPLEKYFRDNAMYLTHAAAQRGAAHHANAAFLLGGPLNN